MIDLKCNNDQSESSQREDRVPDNSVCGAAEKSPVWEETVNTLCQVYHHWHMLTELMFRYVKGRYFCYFDWVALWSASNQLPLSKETIPPAAGAGACWAGGRRRRENSLPLHTSHPPTAASTPPTGKTQSGTDPNPAGERTKFARASA